MHCSRARQRDHTAVTLLYSGPRPTRPSFPPPLIRPFAAAVARPLQLPRSTPQATSTAVGSSFLERYLPCPRPSLPSPTCPLGIPGDRLAPRGADGRGCFGRSHCMLHLHPFSATLTRAPMCSPAQFLGRVPVAERKGNTATQQAIRLGKVSPCPLLPIIATTTFICRAPTPHRHTPCAAHKPRYRGHCRCHHHIPHTTTQLRSS